MLKYKLAWNYFRRHSFDKDDKRNLRLGGVVSVYGITFAIEKLMIVTGHTLPDWVWLSVYGVLAVAATLMWIEDVILDFWEENTTEDDELYAKDADVV